MASFGKKMKLFQLTAETSKPLHPNNFETVWNCEKFNGAQTQNQPNGKVVQRILDNYYRILLTIESVRYDNESQNNHRVFSIMIYSSQLLSSPKIPISKCRVWFTLITMKDVYEWLSWSYVHMVDWRKCRWTDDVSFDIYWKWDFNEVIKLSVHTIINRIMQSA